MPTPETPTSNVSRVERRFGRKRWLQLAVLIVVVIAAAVAYNVRASRLNARLLLDTSPQLAADASLLAYGSRHGAPLYQEHCASCHGADMKGDRARGAPNLQDSVWLYGSGSITDIEQTILYGIRSGNPKSHRLAEMPGFGRSGQLNKADIDDVVDYVLKISQQPHDEAAAARGVAVFTNRGLCYDCHASDAYGIADYGAPGLTGRGGSWLYGGDRAALYKSIFDGRHGLCPAWIGNLSFVDIRSLAVYVYARSHPSAEGAAASSATHQ